MNHVLQVILSSFSGVINEFRRSSWQIPDDLTEVNYIIQDEYGQSYQIVEWRHTNDRTAVVDIDIGHLQESFAINHIGFTTPVGSGKVSGHILLPFIENMLGR